MFEDTKVVTKTVNRRRTDSTLVQRKKDKRTNNDLQTEGQTVQ
jgi:hypothetical protein